jgi:anti-anti-sigma regulatory factor
MAVLEPAFADPSRLPSSESAEEPCSVLSLHGDLEASAVVALSLRLAKAIAADDADLVLDLSEVGLLDAAAAETILLARDFLRARSRRLTVRSPSLGAWRALEACGRGP